MAKHQEKAADKPKASEKTATSTETKAVEVNSAENVTAPKDEALANEEKAAQAAGKKDPNSPENTFAKSMSVKEAEEIVRKYSGINGSEIPNELVQARAVLKKSK